MHKNLNWKRFSLWLASAALLVIGSAIEGARDRECIKEEVRAVMAEEREKEEES